MTTTEQIAELHIQMNNIIKCVSNGSLDAEKVKHALEVILVKREPLGFLMAKSHQQYEPTEPPSWYATPEQQLEQVRQLNEQRNWCFKEEDFPTVPEEVLLNKGEVLLLCAYLRPGWSSVPTGILRTYGELWYLISLRGNGERRDMAKATDTLRQTPGYSYRSGIRWVVFNASSYQGMSARQALRQSKVDNLELAGVEVLMATLLFPGWAASWNGGASPYPYMSGLQLRLSTSFTRMPVLNPTRNGHDISLGSSTTSASHNNWCSPSIREC